MNGSGWFMLIIRPLSLWFVKCGLCRPLVVILSLGFFLRVYDFLDIPRPTGIISVKTSEVVKDKQQSNNESEKSCPPVG
jgi:hypothetical protein